MTSIDRLRPGTNSMDGGIIMGKIKAHWLLIVIIVAAVWFLFVHKH